MLGDQSPFAVVLMRIFFANNYSPLITSLLVQNGGLPGQHLWGTGELRARGHHVTPAFLDPTRCGARLSARIGHRYGDLQQQYQALRDRPDVILAGDLVSARLLLRMRRRRAPLPPLVVFLHPVVPTTTRALTDLSGAACLLGISSAVVREARAQPLLGDTEIVHAPWGPELDFPGYRSTGDGPIVSSGKTGRDHRTLIDALESAQLPARVHLGEAPTAGSGTVDLRVGAPYREVLGDLQRASVVAIPLRDPDAMVGITELNDALALGKPVVMTRSRWGEDVDIESIGCGRWVDAGDVEGWARVLRELAGDEPLRARMGAAGRAFAAARWNSSRFDRVVADAVERVMGEHA